MKLLAKHRLIDFLSVVLIFCALCTIWEAIILVLRIPRFILPSPWEVVSALISRRDSLLNALRITSSAVLIGLLASVLAGMIIAIVFAQSGWIRRMLYPYTILLQTVPIVAISPLIVMWAGPGTVSVSLITFIICLAPIIANATQGLISVDKNLVSLFAMHNASPAALPESFSPDPAELAKAGLDIQSCTPVPNCKPIISSRSSLSLRLSDSRSSFWSVFSSGTSCITGMNLH